MKSLITMAAALAIPANATLILRTRQPGDRFTPRGMGGKSQKLADTLSNMHVPATWRDQVPLLIVNGEIAWFVAPTVDGVRGRVAEWCAINDQYLEQHKVRVRWSNRVNSE